MINPFTNRLIINQLYANLQNNINMFYIVRNLQTEVPFAHSQMHRVAQEQEVLKRLRAKVQGICDQEHGYLIQVILNTSADRGVQIQRSDIYKKNILVRLRFSCITFKPSKNEILPMVVTEITQTSIVGKAGPATVFIPKLKMQAPYFQYNDSDNSFEFSSYDGPQTRILQVGQVFRCRCFEVRVEMNSMRILGSLDYHLIQLFINSA